MRMYILLVWRPEATDGNGWHPDNPFDGIEILATASSEQTINDVINDKRPEHPNWVFHIDHVNLEVS